MKYWLGALLVLFAAPVWAAGSSTPIQQIPLEFDRGLPKGERQFESVERCRETPCVVTQHGAWHFGPAAQQFHVTMQFVHTGTIQSIEFFQQSTTFEQKLGARLLTRYPNRKMVNLLHMVETGATNTIYMYGLLLQYDVDEGDPIVVRLTSQKDPQQVHEYYFRFHKTGARADLDLALVFPMPIFVPNPGGIIRSAAGGVAFSFSIGSYMDPEQHYNVLQKLVRAARFNVAFGIIDRRLLKDVQGNRVIDSSVDGFAGAGIAFFDFLFAGYGYNLFQTPRAGFPYVGLEIRHVFEFIRSLKKDTHSKWEKFLEKEQGRPH